jgi:anthranilate phosphoribosyltransferase
LPPVAIAEISGGEPAQNAAALRRLLDGEPGPYRTAVQYSAAAALWAAQEGGLEDLPAYAQRAADVLDNGAAAKVLVELVERSRGDRSDE